jgi:membrane-bound metal-dependent hydrolase YbcI (DUF457 family)
MTLIIIGFIGLVYIVGICAYVSSETTKDTEFHEGGFLGMGYTTCSHRDTTPKDMRMGLLWPILITFWFTKIAVWMLNDLLSFVLLIFGYRYRESKIFNFIDRNCG